MRNDRYRVVLRDRLVASIPGSRQYRETEARIRAIGDAREKISGDPRQAPRDALGWSS